MSDRSVVCGYAYLAEFIRLSRREDYAAEFVHDGLANLRPYNVGHDLESMADIPLSW